MPAFAYNVETLRFLAVNQTAIDHYGYTREEFLAMTVKDIRPPEDVPRLLTYLAQNPDGNLPPEVWRHCKKDGSIIHVEIMTQPITLGGKPARLAVAHDVTTKLCAEEALRRSAQIFHELADAMPQMVGTASADGEDDYFNQRTLDYTGMSPDELRTGGWLATVHPGDVLRMDTAWKHAVQTGEDYEIEYRLRRADGEYRWHLGRARAMRDEKGEVSRWFGTWTDIHDQRQMQNLLDEAQRIGRMGSWSQNLMTRAMHWSDELYRIFGVTPESFDPKVETVAALIHPEDRAEFKRELTECLRTSQPSESSHRIVQPDGTIVCVWQRVAVETSPDGVPVRIYGIAQDVTDLRRAQSSLAEAQRVAQIGSWSRDLHNGHATWSDEMYRIFGVAQESFEPNLEAVSAMMLPDDRVKYLERREAALQNGTPFEIVFRIQRPDGSRRVLRTHVALEKDPAGNPARFFGSSQDITELWDAEQEVRHQASLLNLAHDAIIVRDLEDRVTFWNHGAERLYGWSAEEVLGRRVTDFLYEDSSPFFKANKRLLERGEWNGELEQISKDGNELMVACRWTLVRDEQGEPSSVIAINSDITEQKKLEQQFLRSQRLESIGTLASGVAHDLNNVLVPILMVAPLLRGEVSDEDREKFLSIVESSAQRGANIVKQVLTFARGADGNRLLLQPIHLIDEMSNIVRETFPKSIAVHTSYSENVSAIEGEPTQLHQVLLNLCVNARDAMPNGGDLTLSAVNMEVDEHYAGMAPGVDPGHYVLIQVRDTGSGIPRQVIDKIFDPFFTTKEVGVGTGLGLSTLLGIVKSHGGFVNVYSKPGDTIFKIFLPVAAGEVLSASAQPAALEPGHGETILIVDDEAGIRDMASALLTKNGYQTVSAEDGPSALAIFAGNPMSFKVVLTDMVMPIVDGLTLIRAMRKIEPTVRAIISTGREEECLPAQMEALGINACLAKPYTREDLLHTLHTVITHQV